MPRCSDGVVLSHWHRLLEDFSTSTQDFYRAVEEAVGRRNLPDIEISRVLFSEGGVGSAKREYLRIRRQRIVFDICSAPYGNGHFFSWRLKRMPPKYSLFASIAIFFVVMGATWRLQLMPFPMMPDSFVIGTIAKATLSLFLYAVVLLFYAFVFTPLTYYRLDTAMVFRDSIRSAIDEVINDLHEQKGLRLLGTLEEPPQPFNLVVSPLPLTHSDLRASLARRDASSAKRKSP